MKVSEYYGLDMYSDSGYYVGEVQDVMLDVKKSEVAGLVFERGEEGNKMVPHGNVMAIGDIILVESKERTELGREERGEV